MPSIILFGLRLELDGSEIRPPVSPVLRVRRWMGTLDAGGTARVAAWLEVAGTHTLQVDLALATTPTATGERVPREGAHPQPGTAVFRVWDELFAQGLPAAAALLIRSGCLRLEDAGFPAGGVSAVSGEIRIQVPTGTIVENSQLPVRLAAVDVGRFSLDLTTPRLLFLPGSLTARAAATLSVPVAGGGLARVNFFGREHLSQSLSLSLATVPETLDLAFEPQSADAVLPLHADRADRSRPVTPQSPVVAPLAVAGYRLVLAIARPAGGPVRLTRASLAPPQSGPLSLLSFGLHDRRNERAVWTTELPFDLHLRVGTFGRPTTLLVAPVYPVNGNGREMRRAGSGPLHGSLAESQFHPTGACRLFCEHRLNNLQPVPQEVAPGIVSELTAPWLDLRGAGQRFSRTKPAYAYLGGTPEVVPFDFRGERLALPLVPDRFFEAEGQEVRTRLHGDLNGVFSQLLDEVKDVRHESGLREEPVLGEAALRIRRVFLPPAAEPQQLDLAAYSIERDYGPIKVRQRIDPGASPDYLVLRAGHDSFPHFQQDFPLDAAVPQLVVRGRPAEADGRPLGIVKLSRKFSLGEIFDREGLPRTVRGLPGRDFVEDVVDPAIRSREWIGLLLFAVPLGYGNLKILHDLVGEGTLELACLAVTPAKPGQTDGFSLAGRVLWRNQAPAAPGARPADDREVTFRVNEVDIAWYDSRLTYFHADTDLRFKNFFSVPHSMEEGVLLKILGSYDRERNEIRFLGRLSERLPLLPDDLDFGPIRQVFVRSAEIRVVENATSVEIDGTIEPRAFGFDGFDWFGSGEGIQVDFRGLQIRIPTAADLGIRWLSIRYPSLQIRFNGPQFRFGPLSVRITSLGVDWDGAFDWGRLFLLRNPDVRRVFLLGLRLELMKLPELAALSFERLTFDFAVGLGLDLRGRWSPALARIGINAFSLPGLRLDLMRFLRLEAEEAALIQQEVDGTRVPWLTLQGVSLSILERRILERMDVFVFSAQGRSGFLAYLPEAAEIGPLRITWFLAAQNVDLERSLAQSLVSIDAPSETGEHERIRRELRSAVENRRFLPQPGGSPRGDWIFAAGFDFFEGLVVGKLLFQDNAYYGIALRGGALERWFGLRLAISVLYVKGNRAAEDAFFVALQVPGVDLPSFRFLGGVISLEIVMNGGFTIDVGFPWLAPGGGRRWERAFGAIVTPWQGSGGFYLRKRHLVLPGAQFLQLAGGYALQFGLGASFGGGVFRVWVTAGIYGVLEGDFYLQDGNVKGLVLVGAIGLLVQGGGELNWWIISVRVDIVISAEARTTLRWGMLPSGQQLLPASAGERARLRVDFEVYARASAEACIGGGWFKVCKSISVSIPLRFSYDLDL